MAKQSGLGARFLVGGYDISGDVNAIDTIGEAQSLLDSTDITQSAHSRIGGLHDGHMAFTTFFDTANAHPVLSALPKSDTQMMALMPALAIGAPAAALVAKQVGYDPSRAADGALMLKVAGEGNAYGLEWGVTLTPGVFSAANALTGNNSTFETGIGNWVLGTNSTIAQSSAQHHSGSDSLAITSASSGDMTALSAAAGNYATQMFAVAPGNMVNVQAWVRSAVSARTCSVGLDYYTSGGSHVSTVYGTGVADTTSGWTLITATLVVPATSAWAAVNVKVASTGAGSEVHYVDDVEYFLLPSSFDTGGSLAYGAQAYLQVTAFTGTDATIAVYDSADNVSFSAVTSLAFSQVTAAPASQRVAIANTATVREYVAVNVITSGGFSALSFAVMLAKNPVSGVSF